MNNLQSVCDYKRPPTGNPLVTSLLGKKIRRQLNPEEHSLGEPALDETAFNQKVDETLQVIEEGIENCDADLDWDLSGGILTIECANGSQVIVNRQTPTRQIWVAARSGGFHFDYDQDRDGWFQDQLELFSLLNQALTEQSGESVTLIA